MDSGRFESVLKPYKFHQVMRSLFVPLRLATDARKLEFITELDTTIDEVGIVQVCRFTCLPPLQVAWQALCEATGVSDDVIKQRLKGSPSEDGIVVGDETRLRQIITNLARSVVASVRDCYHSEFPQQCMQVHPCWWPTHDHD